MEKDGKNAGNISISNIYVPHPAPRLLRFVDLLKTALGAVDSTYWRAKMASAGKLELENDGGKGEGKNLGAMR